MSQIRVTVPKYHEEKNIGKTVVTLPDDVPFEQIAPYLLIQMGVPLASQEGRPYEYQFWSSTEGPILPDRTLGDEGIQDGDELRFIVSLAERTEEGLFDSDFAILHLDLAGKWTVQDFAHWLNVLESTYFRTDLLLSEGLFAEFISLANRQSVAVEDKSDIFDRIVRLARKQTQELRVERITVASPGIVELIGNINPIKILADFILAWRAGNITKEHNKQQIQLEQYKVRAEVAKMLLEKATTLSAEVSDHLANRVIQFFAEEPLDTLGELAKDIRLIDLRVEIRKSEKQRPMDQE